MVFNRKRSQPAPEPDRDDPMWVPEPVERWVDPEDVAEQLRRRRRGWRALRHAAVLLLVIVLVGGTAVVAGGAVLGRWDLPFTPERTPAAAGPSEDADPLACERALVTPAQVPGTSLQVLNATGRSGLAGSVGDELQGRGFTLVDVGNFRGTVTDAALVRFPATGEAAALTVAAQLTGAVLQPDETVDLVTVVLGDAWTSTVDPAAAAETLTQPQPSLVTCASGTPSGAPSASPAPTG